ncbi:MAG: pyruvate formate lyase family protein, partial [Chloroflexota bacterium]|nr:pyruvate formate lyase family protein [Chloroflexota bacterium]
MTKGRGGQGVRYACSLVFPIIPLTLALYDGYDPHLMRLQLGPHTGDATKFETFDEFFGAFRMQMRSMFEIATRNRTKGRYMEAKYLQNVLGSCLFERCIESGLDMVDGRAGGVSNAWITVGLAADVIDCLYSIKKLIFDEKKYTMQQLQEAIMANWVGFGEMRQEFLNVPKFGNDIDEVDQIAAD